MMKKSETVKKKHTSNSTRMLKNAKFKSATKRWKPKWLLTSKSAITWDLLKTKKGAMRKPKLSYRN
jgi:hypothetical protein